MNDDDDNDSGTELAAVIRRRSLATGNDRLTVKLHSGGVLSISMCYPARSRPSLERLIGREADVVLWSHCVVWNGVGPEELGRVDALIAASVSERLAS